MIICDKCGGNDHVEEYQYPDGHNEDLCYDCGLATGFCVGCGSFCAGIESFDFSPVMGYCYECIQQLELIEPDDFDPEWED